MKIKVSIAIIFVISTLNANSQEKIEHNYNWHVSENNNIYYNHKQPVYFWVSTSNEKTNNDVRLKSETTPQYSNPMYFDTEGYNTLRIQSAYNFDKRKIYNIRYDIYADEFAPNTNLKTRYASKYKKGNKLYLGKGLAIELNAIDKTSGLETIYYSVNGAPYQKYTGPFDIEDEIEYTIKYYAVDKVGNSGEIKEFKFQADFTAPKISKRIEGTNNGNILGKDAVIIAEALDELSGVKKITYSIDGDKPKTYTHPISALIFLGGEHTIKFYGFDNVDNSNYGDKNNETESEFSWDFTVDESAPEIEFDIEGDKYNAGNKTFVSGRSKFTLKATDALSEIKATYFGINKKAKNTYTSATSFNPSSGYQTINYYAEDVSNNKTRELSTTVYVDTEAPNSGIDIGSPKFFNRDTLFINKNTNIKLFSTDSHSGISKIEYKINDGSVNPYKDKIMLSGDGYQKITFYATDNVNNIEQEKTSHVMIDNNAPEIYVNFSVEPIRQQSKNGNMHPVYPTYTKMYLSATDKYTGQEDIYFTINNGRKYKYISSDQIASKSLISKEGFYTVKITSKDKLGNESVKNISFYIAKK